MGKRMRLRALKAERKHDAERGAAVVEFALLAILLFMLIFGGITTGMSISRANALQTGAREGARFAASLPTANTPGGLDQVIGVIREAATGDLATTVPGQFICVAFTDGSVGSLVVRAETSGVLSTPGQDCFSLASLADNRPVGEERIQVVVQRLTSIEAVAFSTDVTISGEAIARFER